MHITIFEAQSSSLGFFKIHQDVPNQSLSCPDGQNGGSHLFSKDEGEGGTSN